MSLLALFVTLVIWGLIFYVLWWALRTIALPEPFQQIVIVILVIASIIVLFGVLTGRVATFGITKLL